ncbi:MAG: hypothetical protein VX588_07620, partial [Verrucomicrobiota bacterium]|nr:hypothetical protein [Verrucomicrobiota bacterium]
LIIGGRNGGGAGYRGLVDEIAIWDNVQDAEAIAALAAGGSPLSSGPQNAVEFTSISYNSTTGAVELTWSSNPNKSYSVKYSTDLVSWDSDVDDDVASEGDTTTYNFNNPEGVDAKKIFFRVTENE